MTWGSEDLEDLRARYAGIRARSRDVLLANDIVVDPLPEVGALRWGISTVFRPNLDKGLWKDIDTLKTILGNGHAVYDPESVHVTIRSNEGFRTPVAADDTDMAGYCDAMAAVLAGSGPLDVDFRGLVGVPTGVLLCGYPRFDIMDLRRRYFREVEARGLLRPGPEPGIEKLRNTCHASLILFAGPLSDPVRAVAFLDGLADRDYGTVSIARFEVVSYQRSLHHVATRVHAIIPVPSRQDGSAHA